MFQREVKSSCAKDLEIHFGDYFDIMPEVGVFDEDLNVILKPRIKPSGMRIISSKYKKKYDINLYIYTHEIKECEIPYMVYENSVEVYNEYFEVIKNKIKSMNEGEYEGIIINAINANKKVKHAIPIIIGKNKCIFLDRFFMSGKRPDFYSSVLYCASLFKESDEVEIFLNNQIIQTDMHSCTVISLKMMKYFLKDDAKLLKHTLQNTVFKINQPDNVNFKLFTMPREIMKMSQSISTLEKINQVDVSNVKIRHFNAGKPNFYNEGYEVAPSYTEKKLTNEYIYNQGYKYTDTIIKTIEKNLPTT